MIDQTVVLEAAKLARLELDDAEIESVAANLARIATFAKLLEDVALDSEDEAAPIWRP
ncbi:MAG TPA: DUF4089 domain-containing protein [Casimicrobiaceae bacterium]|nr:DUF4089 domain-containing protein [Casimicrobiaceae bacterium]